MSHPAEEDPESVDPKHVDPKEERIRFDKGRVLFRRFWPYLKRERKLAFAILCVLLLSVPTTVIPPFLVRELIDSVTSSEQAANTSPSKQTLLNQGLIIIALTLLTRLFGTIHALLAIKLHSRIRFRLTREVLGHLLKLPLPYFHKNRTGYLMARVRDDVKALDGLMSDRLLGALIDVFKAILCLSLLLWLDAGLALSGFLLIVLILLGVLVLSPFLRKLSERTRESDARSSGVLQELLTGIATIRTNAQEHTERRGYFATVKAWLRASARHDVLAAFTGTAISLISVTGSYIIIVAAAYRILVGLSTFGGLLAFFLILFQLMTATGSVTSLVPELQRGLASLQRLFGILDETEERQVRQGAAPTSVRGELVFEDVSLRYDEDTLALTNLDLHVQPGEVIALVGRSGAGKSSLANLIPRLYEPTSGRILLDGVDTQDLPLRWLRSRIGIVPQDVFLFSRSLRANITYGREGASEEELVAAAQAASAHDFILETKHGYDTEVGERGVRLSGGQRQRIAIAREILRDPPILILDEATSNLDSESEVLVQEAIEHLMKGRTCFVIAHRLSTIRGADRVIVLEQGRILEQGSPSDLLANDSMLRKLRDLQAYGD